MAISHLRRDMFAKMLQLSSKFHQETPSGTVLMNMVQMAESSISNASNVFIVLTRDTMIVIGLVCVLLYLNWQLSLIVALMFPLLSLLSRYYRNRLKDIIASAQQSIGTLNNVVNEVHQGHRVVKLFGGQKKASERFAEVNDTIVRLGKKNHTSQRGAFSVQRVDCVVCFGCRHLYRSLAESARLYHHRRIYGIYRCHVANARSDQKLGEHQHPHADHVYRFGCGLPIPRYRA